MVQGEWGPQIRCPSSTLLGRATVEHAVAHDEPAQPWQSYRTAPNWASNVMIAAKIGSMASGHE